MCDGQDPSLGDEDAATDVSAGLALQGALPGPAPGPAGPAPQDPLAHAGGGAAAALCGDSSVSATQPRLLPSAGHGRGATLRKSG